MLLNLPVLPELDLPEVSAPRQHRAPPCPRRSRLDQEAAAKPLPFLRLSCVLTAAGDGAARTPERKGGALRDCTRRPGDPFGGRRLSPGTRAYLQNDGGRGFSRLEMSVSPTPDPVRTAYCPRALAEAAGTNALLFLGTERPLLEPGEKGLAGPRWALMPDRGLALPVAPGA